MIRRVCLHYHFTGGGAASGPSGRLRKQLKGPFSRPIGRHVEQAVGSQYTDGRNFGEVMAFSYHLCPQENIVVMAAKGFYYGVSAVFPHCSVLIQPDNARRRKGLPQLGFRFFRTRPEKLDVFTAACRTKSGRVFYGFTIMTA